ncbi:hypothetical protein D3C87_1767150 [compost metagenome]
MLRATVNDADWAPAAVKVFTGMSGKREGDSWLQARIVTFDQSDARIASKPPQAVVGEGSASLVELGASGIVVPFIAAALMLQIPPIAAVLMSVARMEKGVVSLGLARGAHVFGVRKTA